MPNPPLASGLDDVQAPQGIGTLSLQDQRRKVALSYDPAWLASPQGLGRSEDLPVQAVLMLSAERDTAVGILELKHPAAAIIAFRKVP